MTPLRHRLRGTLGCLIFAVVIAGSGCARIREQIARKYEPERSRPTASTLSSEHLFFGNPSNANDSDPDNYLIVGNSSVISYNSSRGTANWIAWKTTRKDLGPTLPRPDFRPDPRLPSSFELVTYSDYSGSGYDRGHLVPSADRFSDPALNEETFMMTNIVPQTGALNQYPWQWLEKYVRGQVKRGFDAYQIAGVYGSTGKLKQKVTIPSNCWKVVAFLPKGRSLEQIDTLTRIIAVDIPNIEGIENDRWQKYRTTVRSIEERTGYDLLAQLSRELQDMIETRMEMDNRRR
ncbi:MAG TPA: DNA/RNA non-specific endonuclease [Pyrinomonadaceae bacterium]|nr:DNA/RNA non-specific endonuclease [Pyrinomonadaceae bacterium]HVQ57023.1 DNA/RNA non-specific endonuclease [Pyrinomonadaceae bacterium]